MTEKREKFYTVSARLVFSSILVILIATLILGVYGVINKGLVKPSLGIQVGNAAAAPTQGSPSNNTRVRNFTGSAGPPITVAASCFPYYYFGCQNPVFNYTTGILTVAISQESGYNWTSVTVRFVPAGSVYSHGVPELLWSPPSAVNVTGGMLNNTVRYVNIPITSGSVAVGTNITGSIWAKYKLNVGGGVSYANMSTAVIVVRQ